MGNEMGNRNINGLQVSEQENNETTEAIDHSPNTSFLSLNGIDGLKGVTDYLAESLQTSEKHETENLAAGDFSEPSLAFDDVGDQSQLNSSRENEEKEDTELLASNESSTSSLISDKKPTDLASIESLQEDGNLIHRTLPVGQVSDEECDEVNKESAKALTVVNNEDGIEGFPHHLPDCPLVSEQESNENTEVIDHSPNTSFLSLNGLAGLKGVTDYLADSLQTSEKHETQNLAAGDFSEPSLAFDDVGDQCQLNSLRESEEKDKEDTELLASNESSTSSLMSNKTPTDLASIGSLQEDGILIHRMIPVGQVSDEECDEVNKESAKALTVLNDEDGIEGFPHDLPDCLPGSERDSEDQEPKENTANMSSEHSDVSNDAENSLQSIFPTDLHDVHEKLSDPAQSESDESLILNRIFEEIGSEMDSENQDLKEKTANKSLEHSALSNDAEDPTHLISSTDNHDLHEKLGDSAGSESDESLIQQQFFEQREEKDAVPWVQGTSGKCNELQDEKLERGTCGATVSMDSKISEGYTQQQEEGQQHCADTCRSEKGCAASKWEEEEEEMPHEPVSAAHLHAVDDDINILLRTNDLDEATTEEEPQMEDIENDSFDIQLNGVGPCPGGRDQEQEDAGLEDAMFELAIRTGYSPILIMSKEHEEDPVEETNGVEMGKYSTLLQVVTQDEERIECGSNKSSELSIAVMVLENGTENSGDAEINGDENEEESECTNGEVNGHAEVVADELIDQTVAAANTAVTPTPPLLFEEVVVQKCTAEALLANKEELFTIDILRGNPSENEKQVQDPEATETVKCVTYEYERSDPEAEESTLNYTSKTEESKQDPPLISREARKNKRSEVSATEENVREYRVSTSHEDIGKLSDRSPLLRQRKSEDGRVSAEETDSEKPRTPFLNFLKEEVGVKEPVEKEGLLQKKAVKESKKSTTTSSISREKQKPRSSLFSSCMCCTTAIN
ncbi:uncharacterized protein M6B38_109865 [Iris pallida]|uniref:Uncharacterized protein n=1 Tax=Iris pallida TaxID=29817 RepID=A0AAX6E8T5_IRIPA|nr:uncharacterized protein M6B38_109865 [Iris pallida]